MPKLDLTPIFYFVWALLCLVLGTAGVITDWCMKPAVDGRFWVVSVRVIVLILLANAGIFFVLAFAN